MIDIYDVCGLLGIAVVLGNYGYVQWRRDYVRSMSYSLMNFIGTILYIVSLIQHWNLSSFVGNVAWLLISLYGMYRCFKYMRQNDILPPEQAAE